MKGKRLAGAARTIAPSPFSRVFPDLGACPSILPQRSRGLGEGAYFRLVEVDGSEPLRRYVAEGSAAAKAYKELHRYRIFLNETGCHELFAESVSFEGVRTV